MNTYTVHYTDGSTEKVQATSKVRAGFSAPHKGSKARMVLVEQVNDK